LLDRLETRSAAGRVPLRALALLLSLAVHAPAHATETQWWITDSAADHAASEMHGVVVRSTGTIELGPRAAVTVAESLGTIWALVPLADGAVALGCDRGQIALWTQAGGVKPWIKLPVGQVLALIQDGDGLLAGTGPGGVIYRIGARGDTSVVARTGERYVWGLARGAKAGEWYAATGTRGRLLKINGSRVEVALDTDESNLVSIISDGHGGAFAGGDSKGLVVQYQADGSVRTVYDAAEDEIRALALGPDGALYAGALEATGVTEPSPASAASASSGGDSSEGSDTDTPAAGPTPPAPTRGASAGRAVIYRIVPDSSGAAYWTAPQPLLYALAWTRDGLIAATGNRAAVYRVERAGAGLQLLAAPQGQITALAVTREGQILAAASSPAALWRLGPETADRGELESPVFDARRITRWGRIVAHAESQGSVEIATRSGNTDAPDTTWSAWRAPRDGRVASPPGRHLQWRLTLSGSRPRVDGVDVAWREQNLPPRLDELVVAPQGQGFKEGELLPHSEPVTQTLPTGQKVEYSIPGTSTPRALRDLPAWARGLRTLQWKATDPNGDPLVYKVEIGPSADGPWTKIGEELEAVSFTWDTNALPDGRYRLRVTASDERGNPVGESLRTQTVSEPFTIDNTPPEVTAFIAKGQQRSIAVEGAARDGESPLARIEVAVDDNDWRTVTPDGGFADDLTLRFHATLPDVEPGAHSVGVRVVDMAGNTATRAVRVTVSAAR